MTATQGGPEIGWQKTEARLQGHQQIEPNFSHLAHRCSMVRLAHVPRYAEPVDRTALDVSKSGSGFDCILARRSNQ